MQLNHDHGPDFFVYCSRFLRSARQDVINGARGDGVTDDAVTGSLAELQLERAEGPE